MQQRARDTVDGSTSGKRVGIRGEWEGGWIGGREQGQTDRKLPGKKFSMTPKRYGECVLVERRGRSRRGEARRGGARKGPTNNWRMEDFLCVVGGKKKREINHTRPPSDPPALGTGKFFLAHIATLTLGISTLTHPVDSLGYRSLFLVSSGIESRQSQADGHGTWDMGHVRVRSWMCMHAVDIEGEWDEDEDDAQEEDSEDNEKEWEEEEKLERGRTGSQL